jgi:hypothetical protein
MRKLILFVFILICMPVGAELINGPANVRSSPKGTHVITLDSDVAVSVSEETLEGSWKMIGFVTVVDKDDIDWEKALLKKGVTLHNVQMTAIGKTCEEVDLDNMNWPPVERDGKYWTWVVAYTWINNIKEKTVIENGLAELINNKKAPVTLKELQPHLKAFYYRPWFEKDKMSSYMVHEVWMEDPSPGARVILILYDDKLVSVMYSREIGLNGHTSKEVLGYKMAYIEKINDDVRKELEEYFFDIIRKAD